MQLLAQGAEAVIYQEGSTIVKHRFSKKYRNELLDKSLRQFRTRREAKIIAALNEKKINAPKLVSVDDKEMNIVMSHIEGNLLKDVLEKNPEHYGRLLGQLVGSTHNQHIVHGDLTTSNLIEKEGALYLIDFGLSSFSQKIEDKSVELHLVRQALNSKHPEVAEKVFEKFLESYVATYPGGKDVTSHLLGEVSKRGRNKRK